MSLGLMMRHHALLAAAAKKPSHSGEFIYLTCFENYDQNTGVDIPYIGGSKTWTALDGTAGGVGGHLYSMNSSYIGFSKYFGFFSSSNKSMYLLNSLDFSSEDCYTIDFFAKSVKPYNTGAGFAGIELYQSRQYSDNNNRYTSISFSDGYSSRDYFGYTYNSSNSKYQRTPTTYIAGRYMWPCITLRSGISDVESNISLSSIYIEHHYAFVIDKSKNHTRLYIDGVLENVSGFDTLEDALTGIRIFSNAGKQFITQFAVRKGDMSNGYVVGQESSSTFTVPTAGYHVFTDDRQKVKFGDNWYTYKQFGNKLWMTQDLRENVGDCLWYMNDSKYGDMGCGRLYKWYNSATALNNLLHDGWRLPSENDFKDLIKVIENNQSATTSNVKKWIINDNDDSGWMHHNEGGNRAGGSSSSWAYNGAFWWSSTPNGSYRKGLNLNLSTSKLEINNANPASSSYSSQFVRFCKDA